MLRGRGVSPDELVREPGHLPLFLLGASLRPELRSGVGGSTKGLICCLSVPVGAAFLPSGEKWVMEPAMCSS